MITLMVIGILILTFKLAGFAFKAAWSITKFVFALVLPVIVIGLLIGGLVTVAIPVLILFLAGAFLLPVLKAVF